MRAAPKGLRLHIGIYGRRNAGKSSLLNALTRQRVSLVSEVAGTTTDPVEKPMELLPIGPVLFIDTAGIDDEGALGGMRVAETRRAFDRTDLALLVSAAGAWGNYEAELLDAFSRRGVPVIVVFNMTDLGTPAPELRETLSARCAAVVDTTATNGDGIEALRAALIAHAPEDFVHGPPLAADLVPPGGLAMLVAPIDKEAPKGRLINPQVQVLRELLDHDAYCMVAQDGQLRAALEQLKQPPDLVVTDSQAFMKVAADTPDGVPLTSFSILFARAKGDLNEFVRGAAAIATLRPGARILMAEACTHHPIGEDIGRVKLPRWLTQHVGGELAFTQVQGRDFPECLDGYDLVIHCGACMWNRRAVLSRIHQCREAGVPVTNYGVAIAQALGILERALSPFPEAREALHATKRVVVG